MSNPCLFGLYKISVSDYTSQQSLVCACRAKMDGPYDNRLLPVLLAVILMVALLIVFSGAVAETAGWS